MALAADAQEQGRSRAEWLQELAAERVALSDKSIPEPERLERFRVLLQSYVAFSAAAADSVPPVHEIEIPQGVSPALEEFLVERAQLALERAAYQKVVQDRPASERRAALEAWESIVRDRLVILQALATHVAQQSSQKPLPLPAAPTIPTALAPEMQQFLLKRHQLAVAEVREENRIRGLPVESREAARREWRQQRAGQLAELLQAAGSLSPTPSTFR